MSTSGLVQRASAEAVGTFALVFVGCGAIMVDRISGGALSHLGVSLAFGLVIMAMIHATGHVSGAHFNPAVTLAFASFGHFPLRQVPVYVGAQVGAATVAAGLLRLTLGDVALLGSTVPSVDVGAATAIEGVLTFFLMFVIASAATDARSPGPLAGVAIGGTVGLAALMGGPITGASLNPARSLGPRPRVGRVGRPVDLPGGPGPRRRRRHGGLHPGPLRRPARQRGRLLRVAQPGSSVLDHRSASSARSSAQPGDARRAARCAERSTAGACIAGRPTREASPSSAAARSRSPR